MSQRKCFLAFYCGASFKSGTVLGLDQAVILNSLLRPSPKAVWNFPRCQSYAKNSWISGKLWFPISSRCMLLKSKAKELGRE